MTSTNALPATIEELPPPAPFVLTDLDVFNWGPFSGRHHAQIDIEGTAIIGQTGSGKTTLVDALMTLIAAQPRYNLASTGGHESDRDLVSYVRGVSGAGREGDSDHIARPGKTVSAIAATFGNDRTRVTIAGLFALEGSGSSAAELDRIWMVLRGSELDLDDVLELHHAGGKRALRQQEREAGILKVFDSKKAYIGELRRLFEVGENAFTLLNRAAGLKQLNSIDDLFRDLVLDDRSAFQRALEVASEFDTLAQIRQELEIARKQRDALLPIEKGWAQRSANIEQRDLHVHLISVLPIAGALRAHQLWTQLVSDLMRKLELCDQLVEQRTLRREALDAEALRLRDLYFQDGGSSIELLESKLTTERQRLGTIQRHANDYRLIARRLQFDDTLTEAVFQKNQAQAQALKDEVDATIEVLERETYTVGAAKSTAEQRLREQQAAVAEAKARPGSNIPPQYQQFRRDLADELKLDEEDLPFVAELVEVQKAQSQWRGAIERAIGGNRLRIMVPPTQIKPALAWVNGRDNRLHVRLVEVMTPERPVEFLADGFTQKLNFKNHPYRDAVRGLLAQIDRHCVASPEVLRLTPHGMTAQGLMSSKSGFFEKQDKTPLSQGWLTGFDNRDILEALDHEVRETERELKEQVERFEAARARVSEARSRNLMLERVLAIQFVDIDEPGAQREVDDSTKHLSALMDPQSDTARAKQAWEDVRAQLTKINEDREKSLKLQHTLQNELAAAQRDRERAFALTGEGLDARQMTLVQAHFDFSHVQTVDALNARQTQTERELRAHVDELEKKIADCEKQLVRNMGAAHGVDTGALAEVGSEVDDVPHYLERLRVLREEALPEKLDRFLSYLNQSSDEGVTQLLRSIDNEVETIIERIEDLNATMRQVDFQPLRYLRLEPRRVVHESLRTLEQAQRGLRTAMLQDDQGESQFKALAEVVGLLREAGERRSTVGAKALLDPRYRLQFAVSVIDRASGKVLETRTGSQGGSGGEKEIIASYILTASLSYALCPDGKDRPLFGTIVLDEAFSKSSQAVAGRIISALREFGLHPLFVTPNKEMRLLRSHTRSAILIHRKGPHATMTSLSWEELDAIARSRQMSSRDEIPG
ncbi:ATP-binding protein [Ralstonia syzygii]|uniref:Conserved hypothethical protein n=1 Tax=Ralstonia syzygii R24 TaxID=907261 RepID=G3ACS9_9RALS|nr:SbcC/MukB-like Walker B domain-containing protein [Ralstonia syzygii]CCA87384.1 conserved hypothethical protein [Ralstonia syzygii R24]